MARKAAPSKARRPAKQAGRIKTTLAQALAPLRADIDDLDNRIIELLNARAGVAQKIGHVKAAHKERAYVPERERRVLDRLAAKSTGPLAPDTVRLIYKEIISASLALESPLRVAFCGPEGMHAHAATVRHFGSSAHLQRCDDIKQVFDRVASLQTDYGVVPMEREAGTLVQDTLDNFLEQDLVICTELLLPSPDHLLGAVARKVKKNDGGFTRFLVIGRDRPGPSGNDCTSVMFGLRDGPGVLHTALRHLVERDINMLRIESRPVRSRMWDYLFFVDLAGHGADKDIAAGLQKLRDMCVFMKVLGSYPRVIMKGRKIHAASRQ